MSPINLTATSSTPNDLSVSPGLDIFGLFSGLFSGETASSVAGGGVFDVLGILWLIFVLLSFSLSIFMLVLYGYASTRRWEYFAQADRDLREAERQYDEQFRGLRKNDRLEDVLVHLESPSPNDWKLAIIEADIMLDELLKQRGFAGNTLGERLKSISPNQMESLSDAWEAHKVRNRIAHDGADFVLTRRIAEDTINRYRRVLGELDVS